MRFFLIIVILTFLHPTIYGRGPDYLVDPAPLHRCEKALTDIIVHDIFSPPVASRIYVYANIAAYEILVQQSTQYRSLSSLLHEMPSMPKPGKEIVPSLAAVYAFMTTGKRLIFSEQLLEDSLKQILLFYNKVPQKLYAASLEYGQAISDSLFKWIGKDQYKETRKLRRYRYLKQEGKWIPTPPGYIDAVEPYWNKIRTLVMDSCNQFKPQQPTIFSKEPGSLFYKEAYEVYTIVKELTPEQTATANFWDCNPFYLNTEGHLNFATKKISPGGHWMSIAGAVSRQQHADLQKTIAAYTFTSIVLFDAFIGCWYEKYRSNVIRPETYINIYIDESWRPLLQTPPFPEYTSGHSVISTAAAKVLARIYSDQQPFDDNTEVDFGLPVRHFTSFTQACNEAAISRLYGGIHYRAAIETGQKQGEEIGNYIIQQLMDKAIVQH